MSISSIRPFREIERCRICQSSTLVAVLSLGIQCLTGVFPRTREEQVTAGPLELVLCSVCGLLQLKQSYNPPEMYGLNYGYRSGLNKSMVDHLSTKVRKLESLAGLKAGDVVLDIGSNDGTLLKSYETPGLSRVGMDPTGVKFKEYYPDDIRLIADFFSSPDFLRNTANRKASLITSIAMFYDLEDPLAFVRDIADSLDENGLWHLEQSYMPTMLTATAYDTVCHEHLEYYGLRQIKTLTDQCALTILDVQLNDINGGSFAVTVAKNSSARHRANSDLVSQILQAEERANLSTPAPYAAFEQRVKAHRDQLVKCVRDLNAGGFKVFGYGASTKGNVLLQYCGFTPADIPYIAEVNSQKFGAFTPGTGIPIISESAAREMKPDYFLVLPWHFRENIVQREAGYLASGGKLIFPLPELAIVHDPVSQGIGA